ncbi:sugar-binding transcriptional regulator [Alkalicoccobacillus porphyridii]|uniref:Sugar-binding transcriptional regulator n=1 Tax=Alkalicoccobacillus porphyridii TaxID=2597270 RepID=A0A554A4B2_9BACI|nr:sugar-binding transcriptional regulator [Alkalicoccobacillus porphyridii]TSB48522.1 sugar-binding transcriptional regulator [Alkalicoccobacillus porphyridii]
MYEREDLIRAAKMYYELGMTQQQISSRMKYSRPTISRMLESAMDQGIVKVEIQYALNSIGELEERIKQTFDLKKVFVAPVYVEKESLIRKDVGMALAEYLLNLVKDEDLIGVSWGTTLSAVAETLSQADVKGVKVVQLNGGISKNTFATGSMALLEQFGKAFKADFHLLPVPTIMDSAEIVSAIMTDSSTQEIVHLGEKSTIALFGIGRVSHESVLYKGGYFSPENYQELMDKGAVGDICSRFYDVNGQLVDDDLNSRTIGLQLEELKQKQHSIAMAVGKEKVEAVLGALRGGYLNTLFIDEELAEGLLQIEESARRESSKVVRAR